MYAIRSYYGFIDGDIFDTDNFAPFFEFDDPVDQQKRIAMWQIFHDFGVV